MREWLRLSVLQPYVSDYSAHLDSHRYARNTKRVYVCAVGHFARWLSATQFTIAELNEGVVEQFIRKHLVRCRCPYPVRRTGYEVRAALRQLLTVLRTTGAVAVRSGSSPVDTEIARFREYMAAVCGLAHNTCAQRCRIVQKFLIQRFGPRPITPERIRREDIHRFVLRRNNRLSAGSVRVVAGALRCYVRFRALAGDQVEHLLHAVPSVAHWRLAGLPEVLNDSEINQMLGSFDNLTCSPKRAYAMVRCLTDVGLRASEAAQLRLEDIDWRAGTIRVSGNKSRRTDILPLPSETGAAIAAYVRYERPTTTNRALFVRHVAPRDKPIGPGVVRRAVKEAYQRCGWSRSRVHILRHSMASRLLRNATPLKEIADVLRHRSLDTSMIYTKIDLKQLAPVALPWSGRSL